MSTLSTHDCLYFKQFEMLTSRRWEDILIYMKHMSPDPVYQAFGKLVRLHREGLEGMTQEKLGHLVGLSRTSITNIEKGRQHVALHQLLAIADALTARPEALLPSAGKADHPSRLAKKLPPGTDKEIAEWVDKLAGEAR